jgi:polyisoprenoid-binding protein YceI
MHRFSAPVSTFSALLAVSLISSDLSLAERRPIDSQRSAIKIYAYKSGLFSVFAHDHEVHAPIASGTVDEAGGMVNLTVATAEMRVLDPKVSDRDRAEIQETMLSPKVLDAAQFPEIRFSSTQIERESEDGWIVRGNLMLHGVSRPVELQVSGEAGRYGGAATIQQADFGIKPISLFGGTVKVKDAVRIEFDIVVSE